MMKKMAMLVFFLVVMSVLFLASWYVYVHGMMALEGTTYRRIFAWIFWGLTLAFIVGQVLERGEPTLLAKIVTHIGSVWLSVFLYLFLFVLLTDIVRLAHWIWPFFPERPLPSVSNGLLLFWSAIALSAALNIYGFFNALYPKITRIEIKTIKPLPSDMLTIVVVSDVHIGAMTGKGKVERMIRAINEAKPDLVIFAGDLVDHNPRYVIHDGIGNAFLQLKAPMGVFAVAGNHEFIGHAETSIGYLQQFGIRYLRDTVIETGGIRLIGRDDRDKSRFTETERKALDEIFPGTAGNRYTILIDHQPVEYAAAEAKAIDLMLSGHTHKGQLWPFNFITRAVYPNHYGLQKSGNTNYYTSSGYGTWGPPVRTGNRPELVVINLQGL